jgi:hypothetical protein
VVLNLKKHAKDLKICSMHEKLGHMEKLYAYDDQICERDLGLAVAERLVERSAAL